MKIRFNLLPEQQKKHLHMQKLFRMIIEQEIYILIVFGFLILSLFAIYFILKSEVGLLQGVEKTLIDQNGYQEIIDIHDEFKKVHMIVKSEQKILGDHLNWSHVLIMLSENIDESIVVDDITTADNQVSLHAVAQTREDVVRLKERFREVKQNDTICFADVTVPESDLAVPKNVKFTMSFIVNMDCLK